MAPGWQWWGEREDIRRGENLKTVFSLSRENGWGVAHGGGDEFRIGMKIAFLGSRLEDERCDWVPESLGSRCLEIHSRKVLVLCLSLSFPLSNPRPTGNLSSLQHPGFA